MKTLSTLFSLSLLSLVLQACDGGTKPDAGTNGETIASTSPNPMLTNTPANPAAAAAATYQDLQGHPVEISDYAGKKVFVNYWATWCAPCIKEIPSIGRAASTLAAENYVFLLASDEKLDVISDFLADKGFMGNFIKLNTYAGAKGVNVMPTSVLFDEQGQQLKTWEGSFEWDSAEMLAELRQP